MPPTRLLWTGPFSANLRRRAVHEFLSDSLWIVATPMARDQVVADLAQSQTHPHRPRVYCWDDLWIEIVRRHPHPLALFSDASARSALVAAIDRARERDEFGPMERVGDLPGFRKTLRHRFAAWSRAERRVDGPAPRDDAITRIEWAVFRHYRRILAEHRAADAVGLAAWASSAMTLDLLGQPRSIVFLDPIALCPAQSRVIRWASERPIDMLVTLPTSGDLGGDDPAITPLRIALLEAGFDDEENEAEKSSGRSLLESTLFHIDTSLRKIRSIDGLSIQGGPRGEGLGLILAREVTRCLESGIRPDEILVLVRHWDDDADRALDILREWGIPTSGGGRSPLNTEPALAALRLAASIPIEGWETSSLIRLLRNGLIDFASQADRAEAASVIQSLRVFRGRKRIEAALDRASASRDRRRADRAHAILNRVAAAIEPAIDESTWVEHIARLQRMAETLGLGSSARDRNALGMLWDALEDHARIREVFEHPMTNARFFRELEAILVDLDAPAPPRLPGTVRLIAVDEADGTSARVFILANLSEGTFPTRDAVAPSSDDEDGFLGESVLFARERLQFLHALGAAGDEMVLLVPTTDEKGQDLLPAGFVEDVRRRLGKTRDPARFSTLSRLDPTFREHPDLARAPADARVLAVSRACLDRDTDNLLSLLHMSGHRNALEATAAGFRLIHERLRIRRFTPFDGLLKDSRLIARIVQEFGTDHAFSPSQFESFALCPFQFYQKYVLKLTPVDDRPELRIDHAYQGERVHKTLEEIHLAIQSEGRDVDELGRIEAYVQTIMAVELDTGDVRTEEVGDGLRAIEDEVVRRTLMKYRDEFAKYREKDGESARPFRFELSFGGKDESDYPELVLGESDNHVRLRGKIDRVDLIETSAGRGFRVIDYKTGAAPSGSEVTKHLLAIQLPLYTLAVERFLLDEGSALSDFGYWSVRRKGFERISLAKNPWSEFRQTIVAEVLRLATRLRHAEFPVNPQKKTCTRYCDYKTVCRIGQVRLVEKDVFPISLPT